MSDIVDRATRSRMMSGIRNKDTGIEISVRKALFAKGFRYRLNPKDLPGKPDIVFPRYQAIVFVHGCFWHGHDCELFRLPGTNRNFWQKKIQDNQIRDIRNTAGLKKLGWRIGIVWECALRNKGIAGIEKVTNRLDRWIKGSGNAIEIHG